MSKSQRNFEGHHPIVLVVDDNPAIRDMVSWALELDGFEPAEASEGYEALAWIDNAAREGSYPEVILLDLAMPLLDGKAFLERLRAQWGTAHPFPSIVVITAGITGPGVATLVVDHVIVKPFHVRDLLNVIRKLTTPSIA